MKKLGVLLVLLTFGVISTGNSQTKKKFNKEQNKVLKAVQSMTTAFENKDINKVMASYESKAVVVFEPETPISDNTIMREMFTGMSMANPVFTYSGHEVFIAGDIATHIAPWEMIGKAPDGSEIKQSGLSVAILRRQENGEWLMVIDNPHGQFLMNKE